MLKVRERFKHEALGNFFQQIIDLVDPKLGYFGFHYTDANLICHIDQYPGRVIGSYEGNVVYCKESPLGGRLEISISGAATDWEPLVISNVAVIASHAFRNGSLKVLPKCKLLGETARLKATFLTISVKLA